MTTNLQDKLNEVYNSIEVDSSIPFITGDKVYYSPQEESLIGLQTGTYFIKKISNTKFKLYSSLSLIESGSNLTFTEPSSTVGDNIGTHTFILNSQRESNLGIQKLLRKFPLEKNIENGSGTATVPGTTGMLINGIEIHNYKSNDAIYYGPIESANVLSGGENFDVINAPIIEVSAGAGSIAKIQPVISGSFEKLYVDTQDYNIDNIISVNISGGNGTGAVIEPVLISRPREVLFNAEEFSSGGGVNENTDQIVFLTDHNFVNGQEIIYNSLGNNSIKIGTLADNIDLPTNSAYFVGVTNNKAIKLYNNLSDQQSDTNVVGIFTGSSGTHKFSTLSSKKQIAYTKIINGGEGYSNRKLIVSPTGISTTQNSINFKNHGFNSGEIIEYNYETSQISGITTTNQYYILKLDENSFRLCNAGVGGTNASNYERENYEELNSTGSGYQYFKYPDISVSIKYNSVGFGTTTQSHQDIVTTPVVKGSIIDAYVYESGTGYGSKVLNFEDKPTINIQNGKSAKLTPVVIGDKITNVSISYQGSEYYSVPDLIVTGSGTGAELRAIINNGRISEVKVINTGIGYSASNTKIQVVSSGKNALIDPQIRKLTLDDNKVRFNNGQVLLKGKDKLQYSVSKYFEDLRDSFVETPVGVGNTINSKIIGWAYDGNPIIGPYGYTDPENKLSELKSLESGYILNISNVEDRPSGFDAGFFVEDYQFDGSGDLDEYNGRYEKNLEYPNGVYVYHATIDQFPYFIGNKYKSKLISDSDLNQTFDFNNSNLLRNTLPYKVSELSADYDFINETNDILNQKIEVLSVTSDSIKSIEIQNGGNNYKVGDKLIFDNTDTFGSGLNVNVAAIKGKSIVELNTSLTEYLNSIFTWESSDKIKISILPNHNLSNLDYVTISGFSTNLSALNGTHQITVPSYANGRCLSTITSASVGFTTEIYVSPIPEQVSVGSSISIEAETLKVLEVFKNQNILRIERGLAGVSHTVGTAVSFLPDSFTIAKSIDKFVSKVNDTVFFNPRESVGVGTISGVGYSTSFAFGGISTVTRSIPSKAIYIESHPFVTNQPVGYNTNGIDISVSVDGLSASQENLKDISKLFVVKKGPSLIGLKTAITGEELFFHDNGGDSDKYSFESNYTQILGDVDKNVVTVSVSTSHELQNGDTVTLDVQPNLSVGIGTSTAVRVLYKSEIDNIVVNPIGFNSTGINTITNEITITNHELVTGNKVLYEDNGYNEYFVYKINRNRINLCETFIDSQQNPPTVVSFASTGGSSQTISSINPQLQPIKNNNLVFDLSDSSLVDYSLKLYQDKEFNNEFVSTGSGVSFNVSGVGTVGVTSTASLTLDYNSQIEELFYTLEKDGVLIKSDTDVNNYSSIKYIDSDYNNSYSVSGVAATTFNLNINKKPEKLSYGSTDCDTLEYSTTSTSASGSVKSLTILSSGTGYKKLPTLKSTNSTSGVDLIANPKSNEVGSVKETVVINDRFTYSSDKTLRPKANVSASITLKDSNTIDTIKVLNGGSGYVSAPIITLVDPVDRSVINSGLIKPTLTGSAISSVEVVSQPKGLPDETIEVFSTSNNNGVAIEKVESSNSGIFTCIISTPISNFTIQPFAIGDEVFIEGIQKSSSDGGGFNSSDYGYKFFKVDGYDNTGINDKLTISAAGLTTNTGIAKTIQDYSGVVINKNDYPTFSVSQKESQFTIGETLSSNGIVRDLIVTKSNKNTLKISGLYELSVGEIITGNESGNIATIKSLDLNLGTFNVEYSNLKDIGWDTETGKLSEDFQVTANNDYYQNLSYSIKSSVNYLDQQSPVESLVHTSGLKNFADTQIPSNISSGLSTSNDGITIIYDIIDEKRVDTINSFDNVFDVDVVDSKSKFLKLKTKRLTNYAELQNLNVLTLDNLSDQFSSSESENTEFLSIEEVDDEIYHNYLLRVTSEDGSEIQLTDITILSDGRESVIVENESVYNSSLSYGSFDLYEDEFNATFLRFYPNDPFNLNYDIKIIRQTFNTNFSGVGTESIGFVDLIGSAVVENTSVGIGTTTIISLDSSNFESLYVNAHVINTVTNDANYVKLYIAHDGTDTFMSEYYIDSDLSSPTGEQIGIFTCTDLVGGVLSLIHENTSSNELKIRSNIVGFGTTSIGIGTYRFKSLDQLDGGERSVIYESQFYSTVGASSTIVQSLDKILFNASKSVIQVSAGSTKALHQVMMIYDGIDVYTQQLPFLSVSSTETFDSASGIGTFGGEISGSNLILKFHPNTDQTGQIDIEVFGKSLYTELDIFNDPEDLKYGSIIESIDEKFYNGINLGRINRTNFKLISNNTPIFSKKFNPNSAALVANTGLFTIENHFFVTGEELIYTPNSTIVGVGTSAMVTHGGELPSTVYAIKLTENTFKVAITTAAAAAGIGTTFTSLGEGNAHRFTMKERNSKCIITVDDLVQHPLTFTKTTHTLSGNVGGSLGISTNIVSLSGISTINPKDILLVDDEYMGVTNVGLGTTNIGPITNNGTINLVQVDRGFVGSSASTHTDTTQVRVYKGSFNIVDDEIHFSEPPRGNPQIDKTRLNLDFETSSFAGRVFLKSNYDNNKIYDDISDEFSGIGRTFTLKVGGANTTGILGTENIFNEAISDRIGTIGIGSTTITGIGTTSPDIGIGQIVRSNVVSAGTTVVSIGNSTVTLSNSSNNISEGLFTFDFGTFTNPTSANGLIFINSIYQSPKTDNNPSRFNYEILEDSIAGISSVEFSGITSYNDPNRYIVSDYDVNQNETPRGGLIVSYGSTPGLGFAPLVGASVTAVVGAGGSIVSVGLGTTDNIGSGYNGLVSIGVTVLDAEYDHKFVSAGVNSITDNTGGTHTATDATYNSRTGDLVLTIVNHGLTTANTIGIATEGLVFTCSKDDHATNHPYPRAVSKTKLRRGESGGDPIHDQQVTIASTTLNTIQIGVGSGGGAGTGAVVSVDSIGIGGTLSFNVGTAGTNYVNPEIFVSDPSYENLPVVGVSRLGIGATTDTGIGLLMDLKVGGSTGIGSTYFEVTEFKFSRPGYGFQRGDVFKPVGLVTDGSLSSPISDFEITVVDTYSDTFAAWEFGELDYIDSISQYQDGSRVRFPLNYNSELLSFEPKDNSPIEKNINNVLIIFINGILQEPITNYLFEGGTSFAFTKAPLVEDKVDIYFYKGVDGVDAIIKDDILPTIKPGDTVQVISNNIHPNTITQDERAVYNLTSSDKFETNRYSGLGVNDDTNTSQPLSWTKQKTGQKINGEYVYKSRDTLEPLIFPTARIIKDVSISDTEIFIDTSELFKYESGLFTPNQARFADVQADGFGGLIVENTNPVTATFSCSVGVGRTITGITTTNPGSGYSSDQTTISLRFESPPVGVATTATAATATATIANGSVSSVSITNPGFGYTNTDVPSIFAETPNLNIEKIITFNDVDGFSGIVTGIGSTAGTGGNPLALQFNIYHNVDSNYFNGLNVGNPIYIYDTRIGSGVTSINNSDSAIVGIGTEFLDNVYYISAISNNNKLGIITCNVKSDSNIIGIETTGSILNPVGKYSWGRLSGGTRSENPISIGVTGNVVSGLSTYPTIQRRDFGIRKTGALPKIVS